MSEPSTPGPVEGPPPGLGEAQELHEKGRYPEAIERLAAIAAAGPGSIHGQSALCRIAAIQWYDLSDASAALATIGRMTPAASSRTEVRILLDRLTEKLLEELRALVRRGDRREAFSKLQALRSRLPADHPRIETLDELFFQELASEHLATLDERLARVNRQLNIVSGQLAKVGSGDGKGDGKGDEKTEETECGLRIYALSEERERLNLFRAELTRRERRFLSAASPDAYLAFLEGSGQDRELDAILEDLHRLCLEKMHYKTTFHIESKDYLASLLPAGLGRHLTHDVYRRVRDLQARVDASWQRFVDRVYAGAGPA